MLKGYLCYDFRYALMQAFYVQNDADRAVCLSCRRCVTPELIPMIVLRLQFSSTSCVGLGPS